jgi:hypothetical protein
MSLVEIFGVWIGLFVICGITLKDATSLSWGVRGPLDFVVPTLTAAFVAVVGFGLPRMELLPQRIDLNPAFLSRPGHFLRECSHQGLGDPQRLDGKPPDPR